jgi:hypothetical protein
MVRAAATRRGDIARINTGWRRPMKALACQAGHGRTAADRARVMPSPRRSAGRFDIYNSSTTSRDNGQGRNFAAKF